MHICSVEVHDINYAALVNDRMIHQLLAQIAKKIGAEVEAGPYGTSQHLPEHKSYSILWVLALVGTGFIVFNSAPHEEWFSLVVSNKISIDKRHIVDIVERTFCKEDSIGRKLVLSQFPQEA